MSLLKKYCLVLFFGFTMFSQAQTKDSTIISVEEMARKRQDPVAGLRSIYFQGVLLPVNQQIAQSYSIQPVWPVKLGKNLKLITYTIIPFQFIPATGSDYTHVPIENIPLQKEVSKQIMGLSNILFNGYFSSIKKKGKISWEVGPALQLPTRTNPALGSNRIGIGPSLLFNHGGNKLSGGFVIQNYWSLGGEEHNKINTFNLQYYIYYNLSKGWFLESNATILNNWLANKEERMLLPLGGGGGKTFQIGNSGLFYCMTFQLFYNVVKPTIIDNWEAVVQFQIII